MEPCGSALLLERVSEMLSKHRGQGSMVSNPVVNVYVQCWWVVPIEVHVYKCQVYYARSLVWLCPSWFVVVVQEQQTSLSHPVRKGPSVGTCSFDLQVPFWRVLGYMGRVGHFVWQICVLNVLFPYITNRTTIHPFHYLFYTCPWSHVTCH
jgi:hypothetical protein